MSIRDKFASKRKQKQVFRRLATYERRATICAAPLAAKFYRCHVFWRNFIPSFGFLYIVPTLATAPFGIKFHRRAQSVFYRSVRFVVKFYRRPQSAALNHRSLQPARNKARCRSTA